MGTCTHTEVYKYINMCVVCVHVLLRCDAGAMMPNEFKTNMELSNGAVSGSSGSTPALENMVKNFTRNESIASSDREASNYLKNKWSFVEVIELNGAFSRHVKALKAVKDDRMVVTGT